MVPLKPENNILKAVKKLQKIDIQKMSLFLYLGIILFGTFSFNFVTQATTTTIEVNSTGDQALAASATVCDTDLTDGDTVTCTLRAAIEFANARAADDTNTYKIVFTGITGDDNVVSVASSLPAITKKVEIDGTDLDGDVRDITIEGAAQAGVDGFLFEDEAHGSKLENLVVRGFANFNLKIDGSTQTDGASTYLIQNNYFGVDQDGSTVYTTTSNYNVYFNSSDYITFNNNTASGKRWYHLYASSSHNINIQNSNLGTTASGEKVVDNLGGMVVSGYGVWANNSNNVTVDSNVVGGIEGSYAIQVQRGDNFAITDNRVCISVTNANLCKDGYGIQVDGAFGDYSTGGTITGNVVDGADDTNTSDGLIYGVGLQYVDNLTFSNNIIGMTNGFSESGSSLLKMSNVHSSTFSKGANGAFGTSLYGIYFLNGDIYDNTFENFDITWSAGTPSGATSSTGGFSMSASRMYNNVFENIKISGTNNGMYNLDSAQEEFNYFDGVMVFDVTNSSFSNVNPLVNAQNGLQSGTPTVNSTSYSNGDFIVNIDVSATVTGESCTFIAYISDVDGEADTYLVDSQGNRQIAGTLESGTCTLTNQDFIIPETYTVQNTNYIVTAVTDIIASDTLHASTTVVSDVKETSSYSSSATATFNLPVTANITVDDGDTDDTEAMFPKNTTITLDASTSVNGGSYKWDLNNEVDSDGDGTPDNDEDATGTAVEVNYITNQVNGASFATDLSGDLQFEITLTATGVMGDTQSVTKELILLDPIIGDFTTCAADPGGGYQIPLSDDSTVTPDSLYWDFDTLTDAEIDGDNLTTWDADTNTANDQQSTLPTQLLGPTYEVGNYTLSLNHLDTSGEQIATATVDIEVVDSISAPAPTFTYTVVDGLQVSFAGSATGNCITAWSWDFDNDGTEDSTEQNPTFTFAETGTYTVKLTATNSAGSVQSDGVEISVTDTPPTANFTANTTNITQGESVEFTDTSTGLLISSYSWDLNTAIDSNGDGITSNDSDSTEQNPTLTYSDVAGLVTTKLTVTNPAGSDTHTIDINVTPKAEFTLDDGSGNAALEFDGTDDPVLPNEGLIVPQSQNITMNVLAPVSGVIYTWDLNTNVDSGSDGISDVDSISNTVIVNYETGEVNGVVNTDLQGNTGDITVSLTASISGLETTQTTTFRLMNVDGALSSSCLAKNTEVTFTNSSTGFESSSYDFGDGSAVVTHLENTTTSQTHTYTTAGTFNAELSIFDNATADGQSETKSIAVTIEDKVIAPLASSTYSKYTPDPADDFHAQFTNTSTGGCLTYEWDFDNDGMVDSTSQNPTYDFGALGTYEVSLTAANSIGSDTYTFDVVITDQGPSASFNPDPAFGATPLTVDFENTSQGSGIISNWDFDSDGTVDSYVNNTQKEFTDYGVYNVELSVSNYEGSSTTNKLIVAYTLSPSSGNTETSFSFNTTQDDQIADYDYEWDFNNDGTVDKTDANPSHMYTTAGTYNTKLIVTSKANPALTSTITIPVTVDAIVTSSGSNNSSSSNYTVPTVNKTVNPAVVTPTVTTPTVVTPINIPVSIPVTQTTITEPTTATTVTETITNADTITNTIDTATEDNTDTTDTATEENEDNTGTTDTTTEENEDNTDTTDTATEDTTETDTTDTATEENEENEDNTDTTTEVATENVIDNLANLLTGALFATEQVQTQVLAPQVQTQAIKVENQVVSKQLDDVFAKKTVVKQTNQEKQTQIASNQSIKESKRTIVSKVVVDTAKQKEIAEKIVEKVRLKKAQDQDQAKTIQAQDDDNNGVSDAIQELIGLSNEEIEVQKQEDPNLLAPRAIFLNPNNATADIMLEMRESETYPDNKFIANGIVDAPQAKAGDIVEFYAQKDGEKLLIGSSQLDQNKNFSYINRSELEAGQYDIVAKLQSDNATQTEFSVPVEVTIDPQAQQIPITLDGFAGQAQDTLLSSKNTAFASTQGVISGVVLQPGEPVSLALNVDSELARVVVNFNSVLYSATAITSSTNSELEVQAPLELAFEPGTSHTATAFAESLEDPSIKSKPIIIEFSIAKPKPWYTQPFALIAFVIVIAALGLLVKQDQQKKLA